MPLLAKPFGPKNLSKQGINHVTKPVQLASYIIFTLAFFEILPIWLDQSFLYFVIIFVDKLLAYPRRELGWQPKEIPVVCKNEDLILAQVMLYITCISCDSAPLHSWSRSFICCRLLTWQRGNSKAGTEGHKEDSSHISACKWGMPAWQKEVGQSEVQGYLWQDDRFRDSGLREAPSLKTKPKTLDS